MADNKPTTNAPVAEAKDNEKITPREEITQAVRLLRFKLSSLEADARRSKPFLARTQAEAQAKFNAAITVLREFSETNF